MDHNYDCDNIVPSIIQNEPLTMKKEPFAFHMEKRSDVARLSKTRITA